MNARERLADLAADETASVYASPRGRLTTAEGTSASLSEIALALDDARNAPGRRAALAAAFADAQHDRPANVVQLRTGAA